MKTINFETDSPAEQKYHGSGWALAVIGEDDKILDLKYLLELGRDVESSDAREEEEALLLADARAYAETIGNVHLGMCSGRQFCDPVSVNDPTGLPSPTVFARIARLIGEGLDED